MHGWTFTAVYYTARFNRIQPSIYSIGGVYMQLNWVFDSRIVLNSNLFTIKLKSPLTIFSNLWTCNSLFNHLWTNKLFSLIYGLLWLLLFICNFLFSLFFFSIYRSKQLPYLIHECIVLQFFSEKRDTLESPSDCFENEFSAFEPQIVRLFSY